MNGILRRATGLLASMRLDKTELEETRQQLDQTKRQLKRTRERFRLLTREYLLCRMPRRSVCAEIGVHEGEFSEQILSAVEPQELHLIDPWIHEEEGSCEESRYGGLGPKGQAILDERYERVKERFAKEIRTGQVRLHRNLSNVASNDFDDNYFDWIYVDGNHLYEFVMQDLQLYLPKLKPGGYITGDDYGVRGWWDNGVERAVNEFVSQNDGLMLEVRGTQFIIGKGA